MSEKIGKCTECGAKSEVLFDSCVQDSKELIREDEEICVDCMSKRDRGEIAKYMGEFEYNRM